MERQPTNVQTEMITELNTLLNQIDWDAQQASYVEGDWVNLLLDPMPSEIPQHVHVPLTVIALGGQSAALAGARIELHKVGNTTIHYGHLSQRGQLLLRNLPLGRYQLTADMRLASAHAAQRLGEISAKTSQTLHQVLEEIALPAHDPLADSAQFWQLTYHDDDGIFTTNIERQGADQFTITFTSPNRQWDGALFAFTWQAPYARISQRVDPLLRFAVMRWDEAKQICTTELHLSATSAAIAVGLPVKPYPTEALTDDLITILQFSVQSAVTEHARQGWHYLVEGRELPTKVANALSAALNPLSSSLWQEVATSVFRLTHGLQIKIGHRLAQFAQLPATLAPQAIVIPTARSQDLSATQGQVVTLESPDHELAINLSVLPGQDDKTAQLGVWLKPTPTTHLTGPVRITLRDEYQQMLRSESMALDGKVDFTLLTAGVYGIEVKQKGKSWQWSVTIETEAEATAKIAPETAAGAEAKTDKPDPVRRHTNIHFPAQCKLGEPTPMSVQLTLDPIAPMAPANRQSETVDLAPTHQEQAERSIELLVMVSARTFTVEPAHQRLLVPFDGDSQSLVFQLTAHQSGEQIIEVRFFHQTARVGYVGLTTTVVATEGPASNPPL